MTRCREVMATKAQDQHNRGTGRTLAVVLLLFAVVMAFYVGSFLLMRG